MILAHIKQYLRAHKHTSLNNLALHFETEPDAMRGMLEHWIRKGRVQKHEVRSGCQGCSHCDASGGEVYEWIAS